MYMYKFLIYNVHARTHARARASALSARSPAGSGPSLNHITHTITK